MNQTAHQPGALHARQPEEPKPAPPPPDHPPRQDRRSDEPAKPPIYKRRHVLLRAGLATLILGVGVLLYWLHARHYESTDDAFIDGHVAQISPQIPAAVLALHVDDNQLVRAGDLLVELDPINYRVALEQAQAQLGTAQAHLHQGEAQITAAQAAVVEASAEVESAQVSLGNATKELRRLEAVDARARSRQQLDNAYAAQQNAQAQLDQAKARQRSAEANVTTAQAQTKANSADVRAAEATVKRAEVNLGYCQIRAPRDGRVTQRTVEVGNYLQPGQMMFLLVSPDVWVTANFKETQLKRMQPGQPVEVKVDAFPGQKFHAHVDSIQAGSGARFSVLPAENATGNFVKVVQRVPVKIVFDQTANRNHAPLLAPGLSVIPKVKVF